MSDKVTEWRPVECGTRIGDVVREGKAILLKVKCRRCSKKQFKDVFHMIALATTR